MTSDEALIGRIAAGDRLAMEVLFGRHQVRVFRFARRLLGNEASAEDVVSEAFLEVWQTAARYQSRSSVTTWLLAITRNKALSALRRCRPEYELDETVKRGLVDPGENPEEALQKKDKGEALHRCLSALSREHREIIDLVYYHEQSAQEVSQIIGIPENTVKTRMFYARKHLSELLKSAGVDRSWP